ncbi:MAG TPA: hypothetical protein DEQ02_01935 [Ruminococcaceae bacterium]|nr:hypothetical protein [Oscillospiraceae bacterium]
MNIPTTSPQCLLKYKWVKLPRQELPQGKGVMGAWARLASRAAFRPGQAKYCGHINDVPLASWVGGIVGLKSILGIKERQKALAMMDKLSEYGYITYSLDSKTKKLSYTIKDWVVECSGAACSDGVIYATEGYGFLCLPRNITARLADSYYKFDDSDAWLDLWCHTVWQDKHNAFSHTAPAVQFGQYGAILTLEKLGIRWGWDKTKVWRFLQKHRDVFTLHKLPGSFGCLVFNTHYPTGAEIGIPSGDEIMRILDEIRIRSKNTHFQTLNNERLNKSVAWYSKNLAPQAAPEYTGMSSESRVSVFPTYISLCWNCNNCSYDCWGNGLRTIPDNSMIRGPCDNRNSGGFGYE